ncbi:MAG: hypothetical protein NZ602_01450, partial [Thermoguttaceae bacterium]|nr:hypothetical protein [Thermoguttaceae bacterium]MDW8038026.1 hypothetical protein [Thermoguttaceae bacterium]
VGKGKLATTFSDNPLETVGFPNFLRLPKPPLLHELKGASQAKIHQNRHETTKFQIPISGQPLNSTVSIFS